MMMKPPVAISLRFLSLCLALTLWAGPTSALPASGQLTEEQRKICAEPIRRQERAAGIPDQLLAAVARAESGRWDKTRSASFAWPWTVTAEGKGQFFASKEEAIRHIVQLRQRGIRNIDVGCMQVNLMHHPDAFANLEEALDPAANVAYATSFLKQLFEQSRSWVTAVGNYHSATPEFHMRYRQKVMQLWNDERRRAAEARRQEVIAAHQQRRLTQQASAQPGVIARESATDNVQVASADLSETLRNRFAPKPQHPPAHAGAIQPSGETSFRVMSQIPSASGATQFTTSPAPIGARVLPRGSAVPMERRY